MSSAREYAVVLALRAKDMATGTVRNMTAHLAALRGQVAAFGRTNLGTAQVANALSAVHQSGARVVSHLQGALAPAIAATGIAAIGSAAGLWHLVRAAAEGGDKLGEMSDRLGIAPQRLREWQFAAQRAGADSESLEVGLKTLSKSIGQAVNGTGEGKEVFAALGISLKTASGQVKGTDAVMMELAAKIERIPNAAERAAVASALLGKQGYMLAPMFAKGAAGLEEWFAQARRFGVVSDEQIKTSGDFMDSVDDMDRAVGGFGRTLAGKLIPYIKPLVEDLTEWLIANRQLVSSKVGEFVKGIAEGLRGIDYGAVVDGALGFARAVQAGVEMVGGWKMALAGIGVAMVAGPILSTLQLTWTLAQLGAAIATTTVKFAMFAGAQTIGAIMSFVTALRSGVGVVLALNFAMAANPVGMIILAIGALVGLGVTLYNTWQPFREMVDAIVAKVIELAKAGGKWVAEKLGITIGGDAPAAPGTAAPPGMTAVPSMTLPPAGGGHQSAEVRVKLEAAPGTNAQVVSERQNGPGNMNISTDLAVGMGWAAG